jgi:hypothetical protein
MFNSIVFATMFWFSFEHLRDTQFGIQRQRDAGRMSKEVRDCCPAKRHRCCSKKLLELCCIELEKSRGTCTQSLPTWQQQQGECQLGQQQQQQQILPPQRLQWQQSRRGSSQRKRRVL